MRRCAKHGMEYTREKETSSRVMLEALPLDPLMARIPTNSMETGAKIRRAHANCMVWLRIWHEAGELNVSYWGLSVIYSYCLRMNPTATVVPKQVQEELELPLLQVANLTTFLGIILLIETRRSRILRYKVV